jgi:hypothetical protein
MPWSLRSFNGPGLLVIAIVSADRRPLPIVLKPIVQPISGDAGRVTDSLTQAQIPPN